MSSWLTIGEQEYLQKDNEWHDVLLDVAGLMQSYAKRPNISDSKEYAARAISFLRSHLERELAHPTKPKEEE